jgi:hypothetical protein
MVTKILDRVFACKKAPTKSSCFTRTLSLAACARNIFSARKDAVGDHLSFIFSLICRSLLRTILHLSLSKLPSLNILTLKISMMGMLTSPSHRESNMNVCASIRVFSSLRTEASQALFTTPSGILRMSLMVRGAGSHEWASFEEEAKCWCASAAHASNSSRSEQVFVQSTTVAMLAYLGLGLRMRVERRVVALESSTMGVWSSAGVVMEAGAMTSLSSYSSWSSSMASHRDGVLSSASSSSVEVLMLLPSSTGVRCRSAMAPVCSSVVVMSGTKLWTGCKAKLSWCCCHVVAMGLLKCSSKIT